MNEPRVRHVRDDGGVLRGVSWLERGGDRAPARRRQTLRVAARARRQATTLVVPRVLARRSGLDALTRAGGPHASRERPERVPTRRARRDCRGQRRGARVAGVDVADEIGRSRARGGVRERRALAQMLLET